MSPALVNNANSKVIRYHGAIQLVFYQHDWATCRVYLSLQYVAAKDEYYGAYITSLTMQQTLSETANKCLEQLKSGVAVRVLTGIKQKLSDGYKNY